MIAEVVLWLLAVQACAAATLPLSLRLFRRLPDRGYALAKPLGLLVASYVVWLPAMLGYLHYTRASALLMLGLVALAAWWGRSRSTVAWLATNRKLVLAEEAILLISGGVATFIRAYNPDIIGQEKFMDLAFFNAFLATRELPAEDAWLSGYGMPYYPFAYFMFGLPAKLAGLSGAIGYNLALVLVFGLGFLCSAALVADLVALLGDQRTPASRPGQVGWAAGVAGAALIMVCGNLVGPLEVLAARGFGDPAFWSAVGVKNLQAGASHSGWLPDDGGWWWHASRVIATIQPDGITEFPFFSYLLGDLHPHFMAIPLLMLVAALALAVLLEGEPWSGAMLLPVGLALGVPIVANTWDVATAWTLYGLAALGLAWRAHSVGGARPWRALVVGLAPIALGPALFSPYFVGYASQRLGLGLVADRTPPISFLIIFGPMLLLAALLGARFASRAAATTLLGGFAAAVVLAVLGRSTLALCVALLTLLLIGGVRPLRRWREDSSTASAAALYLVGLAALGLAVLIGTELVFIRDSFGTRMNTVFKFYYHSWLLLGLAAAPAVVLAVRRSAFGPPKIGLRWAGALSAVLVLGLGLVYPLAATWTKSNGFRGQPTLDGAAFLERTRPADAAAIKWLASQPGRPVVLEALGNDYEEFGRVSTFSGLPTVLGWVGHELQWRGQLEEYGRRQQDVDGLYQRGEAAEGTRILDQYRVRYVFVGSLERQKYGADVERRLAGWLQPVFRAPGATVFGVPRDREAS